MRDHQLAASLSGSMFKVLSIVFSCSQALYSPEMAATIQCLARLKNDDSIYRENNHLPYQLPSTTRSRATLQWSSLCEAPESDLSAFATDERQIHIDLKDFIDTGSPVTIQTGISPRYRDSRLSAALAGAYFLRDNVSERLKMRCPAQSGSFLPTPFPGSMSSFGVISISTY